ncbi:MAG: NAD(P)-dependent oxidoreductase [Candidatus Pacebacteria bacterium]|nr:NAD(P)-dependent oxidoreductase [Candidatus Paceibacterota bacterium]MDD3729014.1 NAD(P)-dependent oxidoreductase [Candidatus Paceibacterota bacterium]MDD4201615.1 NAD(P)-dependent oxidoreductase [Candidatus Paceibacterota bacterium]MDD4467412.1 NAD(P)-dependent oxidoreductase [Candidatus Paceibacterota bacterium]MDD5445907.1 NAD(P)-dependent oxidoreductase [Candidatus Paceibacterota bacterium]
MKSSKRIIITGSRGSLGKILQKELQDIFDLVCIDKKPDREETIALDITNDYEKFRNILKGNDVIIHLAWDALEDFPSENIVQQNKVMAENVYRAAVEKNTSRVIIASSVHANDYSRVPTGTYLSPKSECWPDTPYGATKIYIEHLGRYYSRKHDIEVICIRFGGVNERNEIRFNEDPLYDKVLLYKEDFVQLIRMCIEVKKVPDNFAVFYAVSNMKGRVHSLDNFLGWKPSFPKK